MQETEVFRADEGVKALRIQVYSYAFYLRFAIIGSQKWAVCVIGNLPQKNTGPEKGLKNSTSGG